MSRAICVLQSPRWMPTSADRAPDSARCRLNPTAWQMLRLQAGPLLLRVPCLGLKCPRRPPGRSRPPRRPPEFRIPAGRNRPGPFPLPRRGPPLIRRLPILLLPRHPQRSPPFAQVTGPVRLLWLRLLRSLSRRAGRPRFALSLPEKPCARLAPLLPRKVPPTPPCASSLVARRSRQALGRALTSPRLRGATAPGATCRQKRPLRPSSRSASGGSKCAPPHLHSPRRAPARPARPSTWTITCAAVLEIVNEQ